MDVKPNLSDGNPSPINIPNLVSALQRYLKSAHGELELQLESAGLRGGEVARCIEFGGMQLLDITAGIDRRALWSASSADQMSMLLRRFDVVGLAAALGASLGVAQSAAALLVMDFIGYAGVHTGRSAQFPQ